jgi:ankyrin repeat protein
MARDSEFFQTIERGDASAIKQLLAGSANLVAERNNFDARRPTPLHAAAKLGSAPIVKLLLRSGADANALDAEHTSPLGVAAVFGHLTVVQELLAAGAHASIRNKFGFTPLAAALAGEQGKWRHYSSAPQESWQAIVAALRAHAAEL